MPREQISLESIHRAVDALLASGQRSAIVYHSRSLVAKATCQRRIDLRDKNRSIIVTFGAPNYEERAHIRSCKKMGMAFPLKSVELKFWPKKKK